MFKSKFLLVAVTLTTLMVTPGLVQAQQTSSVPISSSTPNANLQQKCQSITSKINTMITIVNTRLQKRQTDMTNRNANIQKRIQNLQSRGADVTKLSSDAQQLASLFNQWVSDYQKYISLLQSTQNFTCGDSQGKFKAAVQAARDQLNVVRQDNQNIKSFTQQTLQPDFLAARQSLKGKKANPSGSTTTGTTISSSPAPIK